MNSPNENDLEVIFDPVSKGAVVRRGMDLTYLDGPFPTLREAVVAARSGLVKPSLQSSRS